jgi:hypothetical protein
VSDEWVGCQLMIENNLLTAVTAARTFNDTQACYATDPNSSEFANDPCCNPT